MRIILVAVLASFLFYSGISLNVIYVLSVVGLIISGICLYPLLILKSNLQDIGGGFAERLLKRWVEDAKPHRLISDIIVLNLLHGFNLAFIGNAFLTILFCVGILTTLSYLILHLRSNYLEDFRTLLEIENRR